MSSFARSQILEVIVAHFDVQPYQSVLRFRHFVLVVLLTGGNRLRHRHHSFVFRVEHSSHMHIHFSGRHRPWKVLLAFKHSFDISDFGAPFQIVEVRHHFFANLDVVVASNYVVHRSVDNAVGNHTPIETAWLLLVKSSFVVFIMVNGPTVGLMQFIKSAELIVEILNQLNVEECQTDFF